MTPEKTSSKTRSRLIFVAIVCVFVGPIIIAWLFASRTLDLGSRTLVNQGKLLSPSIDLTAHAHRLGFAPLFKLQPSEWAIVYLEPATCTAACVQALDNLLVVRELLGQGAVRTSVHAIARGRADVPSHTNRVHVDPDAVQWLQDALLARAPDTALPAVVLVDWRHQLMMRYAPDQRRAIQKDLRRLLRASAIR